MTEEALAGDGALSDAGEDERVVRETWLELRGGRVQRKFRTRSEDNFAGSVVVGLFSRAFGSGCWIGKSEHDWSFVVFRHFLENRFGEGVWHGGTD